MPPYHWYGCGTLYGSPCQHTPSAFPGSAPSLRCAGQPAEKAAAPGRRRHMGYWSPAWYAARVPACGLEAGSRLAVVASPVHTGRDSGGGLPGAPCRCALCVQATADRPPPVSRRRLRSLFRRLPLEAPADIRRRSGHISLSASLGQSAGAGRPHTNRPCFRHRPPPTRRVPRPPGAPPAQLAAAAPVPAWSSPLRTAEDGEAGHGGSASGGAAGKRDSRQSTSIRASPMGRRAILRIFRSRCSCVVYYSPQFCNTSALQPETVWV